jgi:hypothetical protein
MLMKLFRELLIIAAGTLFFLALCATVGISTSTRSPAPTVAADEKRLDSEGRSAKQPRFWIGNHLDDSEK